LTPDADGVSIELMRGKQLELEFLAEEIRARAQVGPAEVVSSLVMARRLLGEPVRILPTLPTEASLVWRDGKYSIVIRAIEREAHFAVAHELGHWAQRELAGWRDPNEENYANRIAAAVCAPRALVNKIRSRDQAKLFRPLAKTACISETSAALRLQTLRDEDRAVITANHRYMLGQYRGIEPSRAIRLADGEEIDPNVDITPLRGGIDRGRVQLFGKAK
jgi:Zn-dependent peptidase ImmA (M78 family)